MVDVQKLYRKLYALGAIKAASREAIEDKNGNLEEDAPFSAYPAGIRSIPDPPFVVPDGMKFAYSKGFDEFPANFDFSLVRDGDHLFYECRIKKAPVLHLTNAYFLFTMNYSGQTLLEDATGIHINGGSLYHAFEDQEKIKTLNPITISPLNSSGSTQYAPQLNYAFNGCYELEEITIHLDGKNYNYLSTDGSYAFYLCRKLRRINLTYENAENISYKWSYAFYGENLLEELPVAFFELAASIQGSGSLPDNLRSIPAFDASKLTGNFVIACSYRSFPNLTDIGQITNLAPMLIRFRDCPNLTLQSMVNVVTGLKQVPTPRFFYVASDVLARMQADTASYTWNGQTYTGIIALANAKGWTVSS